MDAFQSSHFPGQQPPPPTQSGADPGHNPFQLLPPPPPYYHHQVTASYPPSHHYHQHHLPPPPPASSFPPPHLQQQQWPQPEGYVQYHGTVPPPLPPHLQYQNYSTPGPPLPYHGYPPASAPLSRPYHAPPLPPAPPHLQHHIHSPSPPPPPPAYPPPPSQGLGSPSWAPHQGLEYSERNIPYNNEDEWAARAKAWVAAKSMADNHPAPQVMPRVEENTFAVHDPYHSVARPPRDTQQSSVSQSSSQHMSHYLIDQQTQVDHLHGSASYGSGSAFYGTYGGLCYNVGDEAVAAHKDHMASPTRNNASSSSIYEQEVPYSYSSTQGNRDAVSQNEILQQPLPLPTFSVQEGFVQSAFTEQSIPVEQSHLGGQSCTFMTDARDKPLEFNTKPSDLELHPKISYRLADPAVSMGVTDHDAITTPLNAWTPSVAPGSFSQTLAPSGTQFDSAFVSQPSLAVQHAPLFGGLSGPSFRPNVPPVGGPFGVGTGVSLDQTAGYSADVNGTFGLPERPKKAAVPKWLQEEIIKNRNVIASTSGSHQAGSSYNIIDSQDADKDHLRVDQDERKSVDSTKSSEDNDDDEDEVEAARSAAINQEIKRILTEVLLKVTDQILDEVATKVVNEDDEIVEVAEQNDLANHNVPFPSVLTPKTSAKFLVPFKEKVEEIDNSSPRTSKGDLLGLASYASDEDDEDRTQGLISQSSITMVQESNGWSEAETRRAENGNALVDSVKHNGVSYDNVGEKSGIYLVNTDLGATTIDESTWMQNASLSDNKAPKGARKEGVRLENNGGDAKVGKSDGFYVRESKSISSTSKHPEKKSNHEDSTKNEPADRDKRGSETNVSNEINNHEYSTNFKEKMNKRDASIKTYQGRNSMQGANFQESDSKRSHSSMKVERKESAKDRQGKSKEDSQRRKEKEEDEKEHHSRRSTNDSARYGSRRSPSRSSKGRSGKESSLHGHCSVSSDEPSESTKKRKLKSHSSLSPSPMRGRNRQVSRSPNRKHSHRRHSPYSSTEKRRR